MKWLDFSKETWDLIPINSTFLIFNKKQLHIYNTVYVKINDDFVTTSAGVFNDPFYERLSNKNVEFSENFGILVIPNPLFGINEEAVAQFRAGKYKIVEFEKIRTLSELPDVYELACREIERLQTRCDEFVKTLDFKTSS